MRVAVEGVEESGRYVVMRVAVVLRKESGWGLITDNYT